MSAKRKSSERKTMGRTKVIGKKAAKRPTKIAESNPTPQSSCETPSREKEPTVDEQMLNFSNSIPRRSEFFGKVEWKPTPGSYRHRHRTSSRN
ncbi:MAG: hypothetical protein ACO3JG_14780 [Luteolibacter sp.]